MQQMTSRRGSHNYLLGKNLPDDIDSLLKDSLKDMDSDEALASSLNSL